jgi:hypothetical protein
LEAANERTRIYEPMAAKTRTNTSNCGLEKELFFRRVPKRLGIAYFYLTLSLIVAGF